MVELDEKLNSVEKYFDMINSKIKRTEEKLHKIKFLDVHLTKSHFSLCNKNGRLMYVDDKLHRHLIETPIAIRMQVVEILDEYEGEISKSIDEFFLKINKKESKNG